jgi:hypothetical protein
LRKQKILSLSSVFRYDLELHVVHKSSSGKLAVVGIVYKYGHPDPFLTKVFKWLLSLICFHTSINVSAVCIYVLLTIDMDASHGLFKL